MSFCCSRAVMPRGRVNGAGSDAGFAVSRRPEDGTLSAPQPRGYVGISRNRPTCGWVSLAGAGHSGGFCGADDLDAWPAFCLDVMRRKTRRRWTAFYRWGLLSRAVRRNWQPWRQRWGSRGRVTCSISPAARTEMTPRSGRGWRMMRTHWRAGRMPSPANGPELVLCPNCWCGSYRRADELARV